MNQPLILLMYSGGLDSVGTLYILLTDELYKNYDIHVHHVEIINKEDRHIAERNAVRKTMQYFQNNEYRPFQYSQSSITLPSVNGSIPWDTDITSFISGFMTSAFSDFKAVAFGVNKDDIRHVIDKQINRAATIFGSFQSAALKIFPVIDLTKKQIFEMLPEELASLAWSCRTPMYINGKPTKCDKCKTCLAMSLL